jgi:hypothetical protein
MTTQRRGRSRRSRSRSAARTRDFWGDPTLRDDSEVRIRPSTDPTAMIRSLGPPPLPGKETVAQYTYTLVYQKAAGVAVALAAAADILDLEPPAE